MRPQRLLALFVLLVVGALASADAADRPLSFGVLNQQSPALTAERWNPILHYITTVSGVPLQLKMGPTAPETDAMMGRGDFDFVYTNHNFQAEFDHIPFKVLARWAGEPIRGVIAVPADSDVRSLKALDGKRVGFPTRDAFVAYAVPKVALRQAGVTVTEVFAGNQEGVLAQLKAKRVDAGAVNSRFLRDYQEREKVRFHEIFVSDGYPDLAVIAHPRTPAPIVEKVRKALLGLKSDPNAAALREKTRFQGFEPATEKDYEGVRRVYRLIGP
ncbi:MAG: phosphate/phosphite/phosphonate ABC transporter substrate-binding protein [Candidatus Rokubacteria bacterium]|nr:phosphate/phosphite/phosphonate ABC transporter substrate-binding protein [Candidatus Rokubacteria bacterium]